MSVEIVHVVRGKCKETNRRYKLVRGQVKQLHEARGEDTFDSVFYAIHAGIRAAKTWRHMSISVVFTDEPRRLKEEAEGEEDQ